MTGIPCSTAVGGDAERGTCEEGESCPHHGGDPGTKVERWCHDQHERQPGAQEPIPTFVLSAHEAQDGDVDGVPIASSAVLGEVERFGHEMVAVLRHEVVVFRREQQFRFVHASIPFLAVFADVLHAPGGRAEEQRSSGDVIRSSKIRRRAIGTCQSRVSHERQHPRDDRNGTPHHSSLRGREPLLLRHLRSVPMLRPDVAT